MGKGDGNGNGQNLSQLGATHSSHCNKMDPITIIVIAMAASEQALDTMVRMYT